MIEAAPAAGASESRLAANIAFNLVGQGLLLALTLFAARYLYRGLGADAFGVILFAQTVNAVLVATFELGIASTIVREVAAHFQDEPRYVVELLRSYGVIYWIGYAALGMMLVVLAPLLATHWINLRTIDPASAATVFRVLGLSALLAVPRSLYAGIVRGLQRLGLKNVIDVGMSGLQQIGIVVTLLLGGSLFRVVLVMAATYLVWLLLYLAGTGRLVGWAAIVPAYHARAVRRTAGFSLRMVWISALTIVHTQADKLVVSKVLPVSSLGYYSFSSGVVARASLVTNAIGEAAYPALASLHQRADEKQLGERYRALQDLLTYATLPVFTAIAFAATPLFTYLFGRDVAQALLLPTALLCLGSFMNGTLTVPYVYSLAVGRPDIAARQNFWALVLVVPCTIILTLRFGLTGAAISWVLYHVFAYAYGVPRLCRAIGIAVTAWSAQLARVMLLGTATYATAWLAVDRGSPGLTTLGASFGLASLAFAAIGYRMIGPELRVALIKRVRSLRHQELHAAA